MSTSALAALTSLMPYHLAAWGTLLGMELYQSFVMTKLAYWHLPGQHFARLQAKTFPVYFTMQLGLVVLVAATSPISLWIFHNQLLPSSQTRESFGVEWGLWVPLLVNAAMAELNRSVYGPFTTQAMEKKMGPSVSQSNAKGNTESSQEHRTPPDDRSKSKREFSRAHAMSIHLNGIGIIATIWYGIVLSSKFTFVV